MTAEAPRADPAPVRRTDVDLLRILVCAAVIVAHSLLIFAAEPRYHVKSETPWPVATVLYEALRLIMMPAFFVLAGWAAVVSLRRRTPGRFVRDRLQRLLVPLLVGMLIQGPVIKYIELSQGRDLRMRWFRVGAPLDIGFAEFLPQYFTQPKLWTWSHLWFLIYLVVLSLALLPLLRALARRVPSRRTAGRLIVFLPGPALAALLAFTHGYWPFYPSLFRDRANLAYFALLFLVGAGIAAWPGFETRLRREAPWLLLLAVAGFAGVLWFGESFAGRLCVGLCAWGAVAAAWGFAGRRPPAPSPTLQRLSEATMPVYVLHHIPVLVLGLWLLSLAWQPALQVPVIAVGALAISALAYRWLVQPWPWVRWMVGMGRARVHSPQP